MILPKKVDNSCIGLVDLLWLTNLCNNPRYLFNGVGLCNEIVKPNVFKISEEVNGVVGRKRNYWDLVFGCREVAPNVSCSFKSIHYWHFNVHENCIEIGLR